MVFWFSCARFALVVSLIFCGTSASAQTPANQEQLQRERDRVLRQRQERIPDVRSPGAAIDAAVAAQPAFPDGEQPCQWVSSMTLEGRDAALFQFVLDGIDGPGGVGRCLGSKGVNAVLVKAQNEVIAHGYITTRIVAMPQDLRSGHLTLTVITGRVRRIRLASDADPRGTYRNALPVAEGDILDLRAIEQGLENFKRLPTVQADIQITPSKGKDAQPWDSDLVIQYRQAFPFRLSASLDDGGLRTTGKYQAGLTLAYDNWWTLNDLFYVNANHSLGHDGEKGSNGYTLHYSLPFGYWLFSTTMSGSRYHQTVFGAFENFVYSGCSETTEFKLSRLVYRGSVRNTTLHLKGLLRTVYNAINDTGIGPQRRRATAWEAGVHHREFISDATADANFAYRRFLDRQGAEPASEFDLPQIVTRYGLFLADASVNAPFLVGPLLLRYNTTARAQWSRGELPPQDQFAIGGRYTVRGFDGALTLQAERGWLLRNELSVALSRSGQEVYAGIDTGQVAGPSTYLTGRRLTGAAFGLRGALYKLSYDAFLAMPLVRPDNFATARVTGGFNLIWQF